MTSKIKNFGVRAFNLGVRGRVLAALIEAGDEGITAFQLAVKGGGGTDCPVLTHVESLRDDGFPSIRTEPHTEDLGDSEYDYKFTLTPRAVQAADCCLEVEALRLRLIEETDWDRPPGDRVSIGQSLSGSISVRRILDRHGFEYEELAGYPEAERVKGMLGAAYPMETLGRFIKEVAAESES